MAFFDGDVLQGLGRGLSAADPGIAALIAALSAGEDETAAPGLQAGPAPDPSPLAIGQERAAVPEILQGAQGLGQFADDQRNLDAVLGAPDLEQNLTPPTSAELGAGAVEARAAAEGAQQQADARDLLVQMSGLDPALAAALTDSQLNTERRAAEREAAREARGDFTPSQLRTQERQAQADARRSLEDAARVALAEAQAAGVQGPDAVFQVAGRLGTSEIGQGGQFSDEELMAAAAKVVPQSMRRTPKKKDGDKENDVVAEAVASLQTALEGGDISPESVDVVVRRNWPEQADEILAALRQGG